MGQISEAVYQTYRVDAPFAMIDNLPEYLMGLYEEDRAMVIHRAWQRRVEESPRLFNGSTSVGMRYANLLPYSASVQRSLAIALPNVPVTLEELIGAD